MAKAVNPGGYSITAEPARGLLRITFRGFFHLEDLAGYEHAKNAALARLGLAPNVHLTLCDFSGCIPQSQAVLDMFARSISDPRFRSRRLAIVVSSALGTFQAQRVVTRSDAGFFRDVAEAEAWLLSR